MKSRADSAPRLLIIPGLNDSPPDHWQSWLQAQHRGSVRVVQRDWATPDLDRWAARIGSTVERSGAGPWIAVAHSFGALALARHLALEGAGDFAAALLVAPADPDKFGLAELLPTRGLPVPATMVLSRNDPWLAHAAGQRLARRWGCHAVDLGEAGHINPASGYRALPFASRWVTAAEQRLARQARPERAAWEEWRIAV